MSPRPTLDHIRRPQILEAAAEDDTRAGSRPRASPTSPSARARARRPSSTTSRRRTSCSRRRSATPRSASTRSSRTSWPRSTRPRAPGSQIVEYGAGAGATTPRCGSSCGCRRCGPAARGHPRGARGRWRPHRRRRARRAGAGRVRSGRPRRVRGAAGRAARRARRAGRARRPGVTPERMGSCASTAARELGCELGRRVLTGTANGRLT